MNPEIDFQLGEYGVARAEDVISDAGTDQEAAAEAEVEATEEYGTGRPFREFLRARIVE
jgi:hypothetical protein